MKVTDTLQRFTSTIDTKVNGLLEIGHDPSMKPSEAEMIADFVLDTLDTFSYLSGTAEVRNDEGLSVYLTGSYGHVNVLAVNAWGGEHSVRMYFDETTGVESMLIF